MMNSKQDLKRILYKLNIAYGLALIAILLISVSAMTYLNFKNKTQIAQVISNIVDEKLKSSETRDVIKILSGAQSKHYSSIAYLDENGKPVLSFPPIPPTLALNKDDKPWHFSHKVDLFYDKDEVRKSGTLIFSIDPLYNITGTILILGLLLIILLPTGKHYRKLIINNFESERNKVKANAVRETIQQVRHDSRGAIEAIKAVTRSFPDLHEAHIDILKSATGRLEKMINEIAYSNFITKQPKSGATSSMSHMYTAIQDVVEEKKVLFNQKSPAGVYISLQSSPETMTMFLPVNGNDFRRILSNLLDNAFEAITQKNVSGEIGIRLIVSRGSLVIKITDNGIGIEKRHIKYVSQKGFTQKSKGSGLGLSWSKQKIEEAGGMLEIQSNYGHGTTVEICFSHDKNLQLAITSIDLKGASSVIAIDDDPYILQLWKDKMVKGTNNTKFHCFESGESYFHSSSHHKNAIFLLDYDLGTNLKTGLQIAAALDESNKIYLVTNNFDDQLIQEACLNKSIQLIPKTIINELELLY